MSQPINVQLPSNFKYPPLYKYMEQQYATAMLEKGTVRIGTLYEYRNHWNDQVRDTEEGTFSAKHDENHVVLREGDDVGLYSELIKVSDGGQAIITNVTMIQEIEIPDNNIYCTTLKGTAEVMKQFDCDACVEITDLGQFFNAILRAMQKAGHPVTDWRMRLCTYAGREVDYTERTDNGMPIGYWLKKPFYKPQQEARAVFVSKDVDALKAPIIMDIPEIIPFIRTHNFAE